MKETMENFSPKSILEKELKELKPNEMKVISERFGLDGDTKTLAAIGRDLGLSRERIRQIERDAKRKLSNILVKNHKEFIEKVIDLFKRYGGIIHKKQASQKFLSNTLKNQKGEEKALNLFVTLMPQIESIEKDEIIHDSWKLISIKKEDIIGILKDWAKYLGDNKSPQKIEVILNEHPAHNKHNITFINAVSKIGKKIMEAHDGSLGLAVWPKVNPKTVRDKIYYIFIKYQKPMHFTEISKIIENEKFDNKKVVPATVHNELIADERFVLIGRGIYALKEWGYTPGTVKDVIKSVLKKSGGTLNFSQIYKEVSKQRQVRRNTILINLQTQRDFKKIGSDKFMLRKA